MVVLRCTQKLLRRLHKSHASDTQSSSTLLGDWYANVLFVDRRPLVLAVSSRTLLPVLIPARDPDTLGPRLCEGLGLVLASLGIPDALIREEQRHMAEVVFDKTVSRQILGTMNDFDRMLDIAPGESLTSAALQLAQAPCSPIGMESPDRATAKLFGQPVPRSEEFLKLVSSQAPANESRREALAADLTVKLSPKALRFALEAIDFKLAADRRRLEASTLSGDARADLENDVRFLDEVRAQLARRTL